MRRFSPRKSSIIAPAQIAAIGLAIPLPRCRAAVNRLEHRGRRPFGINIAARSHPRLPEIAEPMSVRMSPKRFDARITSRVGCVTMRAAIAST